MKGKNTTKKSIKERRADNRKKKTIGYLSLLAVSGVLLLIFFGPGSQDSHHTNTRYLLWKYQMREYEPEVVFRFLNVDTKFRLKLVGKTKEELLEWFPILVSKDEANDYQKNYHYWLSNTDFLWLDRSPWCATFEDGKVLDVKLMKGWG